MIERLMTGYLRRANKSYMQFDQDAGVATLPRAAANRKYLLYIHVPFCPAICPFCSFHRVRFRTTKAEHYFRALREEISRLLDYGYDFSSVYVGGGTPTVMPDQLGETLELVRELYSIKEVSVETNPNDLSEATLRVLQDAGVDRLSVGIQSFDDRLLKEMERYRQYGSSEEIIENLRATRGRFKTLNADMIFNLPHQTSDSLQRDLQILADELEIDQISYYPLMSTDTTSKAMLPTMGRVSYRREKQFYLRILEALRRAYEPSSAWCFARRDGMIDEYIVEYDEYVGVGSGSFSYLDGSIYSSTFSINRYIHYIDRGRLGIVRRRTLDERDRMRYDFLMKLFGLELDKTAMRLKYGGRFFRKLWREFLLFRILGAIGDDGARIRLTERGMYYWVVMMREFFVGVNRFRDEMRSQLSAEGQ